MYRAVDTDSGANVAIKILRDTPALTRGAARDFIDEADRIRSFDHPGIVRVLETGVADDVRFFVMEYAAGGSVADLIRDARTGDRAVRIPGSDADADGVGFHAGGGAIAREGGPGAPHAPRTGT